nr:WSC domain-containing protein [Cryptococcus depauperatus CBS 7841]
MSRPTKLLLLVLAALVIARPSLGDPDHWILTHAQTLLMGRLDPIVTPGGISSHVHNVVGASNSGWQPNDPSEQINAACSSTIVGDDLSNYWTPQLYYRYENNTFSPILSGTRIYYYTKGDNVKPFPPGLKMITGKAMSKDLSNTKTLGVRISCDHGEENAWLPNATSHPGGCLAIAMGSFFPSCGLASGDLDSEDHFSHMAWPQSYDGPTLVDDLNGKYCPDSHPIKYPTIFAQFNYYLNDNQPWRNEECTLVLSNGDCSGNTYHADFINGWKPTVLQDAINQCGDGKGPGDNLGACAPLAKSTSESATWECRLEGQIPAEEVGIYRPVDKLPGCNPLWKSSVNDKPTCNSNSNAELVGPNVYFENLAYRTHVPLALSEVMNPFDLSSWIPFLGNEGSSRLKVWGSDGTDKNRQTVGTWEEIWAKMAVVSSGPSSVSESIIVSTSGTNSAVESTRTSKSDQLSTHVAGSIISGETTSAARASSGHGTSESTSNSATSTPSPGKMCKRKKRSFTQDAISNHLRRSRLQREILT